MTSKPVMLEVIFTNVMGKLKLLFEAAKRAAFDERLGKLTESIFEYSLKKCLLSKDEDGNEYLLRGVYCQKVKAGDDVAALHAIFHESEEIEMP